MTEFGSHQVSGYAKPSIFEILAQESLASNLRDAFRHLSKVIAENFPEHLGSFFRHFEEIYVLIDFVYQCIHLRIHGSSFSEHFYSLKRDPDSRSVVVKCKKVLTWSFFLSVFPYLRVQCENMFKKIREQESDGTLQYSKDWMKHMALIYKKLYPSLHFLWEMTLLYYYVMYALNRNEYPSPILHLVSTKLINSDENDFIENSWEESLSTHYKSTVYVLWKIVRPCIGSVTLGISFGAFFLQFLDWWYSREGGSVSFCPLPVPAPPAKYPLDVPSHICPICKKQRHNDAALSCSGFVFCYTCIFKYVEDNKVCPITRYPASTEQIIRIYHDNNDERRL